MENKLPSEYLKELDELLNAEVEKIDRLKDQYIKGNQYEIAGQFRDIQKKILDFSRALTANS